MNDKVKEAQPWFEKTEQEKQEIIAEQAAAAEAERLAAKQAAEEKEKQGYETGITYDQLARTPDEYSGQKVKFSGKVLQVIEGDEIVTIRLAVNDNYNNVILGTYVSNIVTQRVLEDDEIMIYGISSGLYTYESTIGGMITVPSVIIEKIDL